MPESPNVFISWSEERSKKVAETLREWLPDVIQAARPWMSASDIERGTRWAEEISSALATTKAGIICLTRENLTAPWLLFEAGAIAKTNDPKTRVWTYLLDELKPEVLPGPLKMFQATPADKPNTHGLLVDINRYLDEPISTSRLDRAFEKNWDTLENVLKNLPKTAAPPPPAPNPSQIAAETLELLRVVAPDIVEMADEIKTMRDKRLLEERTWEYLRNNPQSLGAGTISSFSFGKPIGQTRFLDSVLGAPAKATSPPEGETNRLLKDMGIADETPTSDKVTTRQSLTRRIHAPGKRK